MIAESFQLWMLVAPSAILCVLQLVIWFSHRSSFFTSQANSKKRQLGQLNTQFGPTVLRFAKSLAQLIIMP
jgi:hypothetical protein